MSSSDPGSQQPTRRDFFKSSLSAIAFAFHKKAGGASPGGNELTFASAGEVMRALNSGALSSRELVEHLFQRIRAFNGDINAFITLNREQALQRALDADEARSQGKDWGIFHGLPVFIKDTFETEGLRTTSGSASLADHVPAKDAAAVAHLKASGVIILGKTSLPEFASDMQSYNDISGTTRNPWDLSKTPGGSTGGGAAALAAGFGYLELGSDIGGSIRVPSHFCGVFGHKPTLQTVPLKGMIPASAGEHPDLGTAGPMARSARDLQMALEVMSGRRTTGSLFPPPRGTLLSDYKVGYILDDPFCPVLPEVRDPLERLIEKMSRAGVRLTHGWPEGIDPRETIQIYMPLLAASFSEAISQNERQQMRESLNSDWGEYARLWLKGAEMAHGEWLAHTSRRLEQRTLWQRFFQTHDAFILPPCFTAAFPHHHNSSFFERKLNTSQGQRQYGDLLKWISFATLSGCPATVAPIGLNSEGLPVGAQIMGPFGEDSSSIALAGALSDLSGGFQPPPEFGKLG